MWDISSVCGCVARMGAFGYRRFDLNIRTEEHKNIRSVVLLFFLRGFIWFWIIGILYGQAMLRDLDIYLCESSAPLREVFCYVSLRVKRSPAKSCVLKSPAEAQRTRRGIFLEDMYLYLFGPGK